MIAKLTKYEFRSSIKIMSMIWGALIVVSILFAITSPLADANPLANDMVSDTSTGIAEILSITSAILYGLVACAIVIITALIIIQRFYTSLLGDEGYLINTLPVKMWHIITSKGIAATCLVIASCIAGIISVMIIANADIRWLLDELAKVLPDGPMAAVVVIEVAVLFILGIVKSIYQIYASISIGQLLNRHRVLGSVGAYIGISVIISIISTGGIVIADNLGIAASIAELFDRISQISMFNLGIAFLIFIEIIQIATFHIVSERILSRKLNLL